ncbi:MAG: type II secretion system protein [Candidatus Moraniibacteriota bacterium]
MKKNKDEKKKNKKAGFTLIEILLVLALIGILSGVVFVLIGDSGDSKRASAMTTARSSLDFVQLCKFKGWDLNTPTSPDGSGSGDYICSDGSGDDSLEEWATLTVEGCEYTGVDNGDWDYAVDCSGANNLGSDDVIHCSAADGKCYWEE